KTLAEKIWQDHVVRSADGEPDLLYIDLQLVHEVTSAQAFDGLRLAGRKVRRPDLTIATEDHNTPTLDILKPIADPVSKLQIDTLRNNAKEFGIRIHSAVTHTLQRMAHLAQSHSVLVHLKWNTFLQHKLFHQVVPRQWRLMSKELLNQALPPKT
ncbi:MAG: hypothetical protein RIR78_296, partial [Actinomycetota bacterium]